MAKAGSYKFTSFRKSDVLTVNIVVTKGFKLRMFFAIILIRISAMLIGSSVDIRERNV